jgi:autotransporter-associated beta strand protein
MHTLQVDAAETFELNGGNLTFNSINLSLESRNSAKILITGDISLGPLVNAAAGISAGSGSGSSAVVDLGGANRTITVADGTAATDVTIGVPVVNGALTKNGAGTLALTTTNTYQGNTSVLAGKLSISSAFLANDADVLLSTGGVLDLDFVGGPDVIDSLFIDGISQATGTWGATGSGAQFTSDLLAGTGLLQVTTFVPPPLSGDYNEDGVVDAADYVVWRDNLGSETALPNDDTVGVGPDDYDRWKAHFGETNLGGTGSAASSGVPEPHSVCLFAIAYTVLQFAWRLR